MMTSTASDCVKGKRSDTARWVLVALLSSGLALEYLARLGIYSVFPLLRTKLIGSDIMLGLVASAFPWAYGILSPFAGYLGDRFPRRIVVICCVAGWSGAVMVTSLITSAWQLVVMRVFLAATEVGYMPTAQALIADFHGVETRARASGLYQLGSYVGIFLAGLPVAYTSSKLGWRAMLFFSGVPGFLLAFLMWKHIPTQNLILHVDKKDQQISFAKALRMLKKPSLLVIMEVFSLFSIVAWVLLTYLPLFIYQRYHVSLSSAAFQATFYLEAAAAIFLPLFGAASDWGARRDPRNRFLACALVALLGIPALAALGATHYASVMICSLIVFGLVMAAMDASWLPMLCNITPQYQVATAYGLLNTCGTIAGALAALIAALVMKTVGLGLTIASLGVVYLVIAMSLIAVRYYTASPSDSLENEEHHHTKEENTL